MNVMNSLAKVYSPSWKTPLYDRDWYSDTPNDMFNNKILRMARTNP